MKRLRNDINDRKHCIKIERDNCFRLDEETRKLKSNLIQEEKNRNQTKADLAKQQRVMNSSSIYNIELENERAVLLLEINQSVNDYKI